MREDVQEVVPLAVGRVERQVAATEACTVDKPVAVRAVARAAGMVAVMVVAAHTVAT